MESLDMVKCLIQYFFNLLCVKGVLTMSPVYKRLTSTGNNPHAKGTHHRDVHPKLHAVLYPSIVKNRAEL